MPTVKIAILATVLVSLLGLMACNDKDRDQRGSASPPSAISWATWATAATSASCALVAFRLVPFAQSLGIEGHRSERCRH